MSETQRCLARAAACTCGLAAGHQGPHQCVDQDVCCGVWAGTYGEDDFEVIAYPLLSMGGGLL